MELEKTGKYIIELIRSVLNNNSPSEKPDDIDFKDIYLLGQRHNVLNMCLYSIEKLKTKPDQKLLRRWNDKRNAVIAQSVVQLSEKNKILEAFCSAEIRCIPLKGCYLKEMYPRNDYREMSDLDILIDRRSAANARDIMQSLGYVCTSFGIGKDDTYCKAPFMSVELHFELLVIPQVDRIGIKKNTFFKNPWTMAKATEIPFLYELSWEDFYVYLIAHLYKHYSGPGAGIRQFIDLWVLRENVDLDKKRIYESLDDMGLLSFCLDAEELTSSWMTGKDTDDRLKEMEMYIFSSGSFGVLSNKVKNEIGRMSSNSEQSVSDGTRRYLKYRIIPPLDIMQLFYPVLKKAPILLPFFWVYRLFVKGIFKHQKAISEIKTLIGMNRKKRGRI